MKKALFVILFPFLLFGISGCAVLIIGGAVGALGGYAISKDTIQGDTDKPYERLWDSALAISSIRGTIKVEDASKGYIEFRSDSNRVWVRLIRMTRSSTRLRVSARSKFRFPNLELAQEVFVKIMEDAR